MEKLFKIILFILITSGIIAAACKKEEEEVPLASTVADFSYVSDNDFMAPTQVSFTDKSINALGWSWDFGNGETSTDQNPVVTYTEGGIYTVSLTVQPLNNVINNQLTKEVNIIVQSPGATEPKTLYFTSRATGKVHYVLLDTIVPLVFDFPTGGLFKPYGIAFDKNNKKVYVSDTDGFIYRYDADGENQEVVLDAAQVPELGSPYGILVIGDKLYWAKEGGIYMSNLDGSAPEAFAAFTGAPEWPLGMAYDSLSGKIYFVNDKLDFSGGVWTINIDGTGLTEIIPGVDAGAIALDITHNKLYYIDWIGGVFMANLDGSNVTNINASMNENFSWGIIADPEDGYLYVADKGNDIIIRSALDGSNATNWLTGIDPYAMTIYFPE